MNFTRVFEPGTADSEELIDVLELLLKEPPAGGGAPSAGPGWPPGMGAKGIAQANLHSPAH